MILMVFQTQSNLSLAVFSKFIGSCVNYKNECYRLISLSFSFLHCLGVTDTLYACQGWSILTKYTQISRLIGFPTLVQNYQPSINVIFCVIITNAGPTNYIVSLYRLRSVVLSNCLMEISSRNNFRFVIVYCNNNK